jgi:hypothetical protein
MGSGGNSFDTFGDGDGNADAQTPQFGTNPSSQASSAGIPSNGGGFAAGAGSGGALGGNGGGGAGGGYNTDVLRGVSGGGGYSGNPGGGYVSASGGFSGYGGGYTKPSSSFDLRQFLPGGKQDPNRKIAGMGGARSSEIGPSHADIWNRLSNRVKEICKLNRLYDCGK